MSTTKISEDVTVEMICERFKQFPICADELLAGPVDSFEVLIKRHCPETKRLKCELDSDYILGENTFFTKYFEELFCRYFNIMNPANTKIKFLIRQNQLIMEKIESL